jgi:hypothetical protein
MMGHGEGATGVKRFLKPSVFRGTSAVVTFVATLVGLLVTFGVFDPGGAGSGSALANAAGKTVDAGSAKVNLAVDLTGPSGSQRFTGEGKFDFRTNKGLLTYDYSASGGPGSVPAIVTPNGVYYNFASAQGQRGPWVFASPEDLARALGMDTKTTSDALSQNSDPSQILKTLKTAGDFKKSGEESLFGTSTTVYAGDVDPKQFGAPAGSPNVNAKAWVDDSGLVRRIQLSSSAAGQSFRMTMELHDFGVSVDAQAPPPGEVVTLSDFQRQQQAQQQQSQFGQ